MHLRFTGKQQKIEFHLGGTDCIQSDKEFGLIVENNSCRWATFESSPVSLEVKNCKICKNSH